MQHTDKSSICVIKNTYTSFSELNTNFNIRTLQRRVRLLKPMTKLNFSQFSQRGVKLKHTNFLRYYDQARLILPSGPYTKTDELPLGQNGNGLKMDKNSNLTEIKRERNGNGTVLPVPLYGR